MQHDMVHMFPPVLWHFQDVYGTAVSWHRELLGNTPHVVCTTLPPFPPPPPTLSDVQHAHVPDSGAHTGTCTLYMYST